MEDEGTVGRVTCLVEAASEYRPGCDLPLVPEVRPADLIRC